MIVEYAGVLAALSLLAATLTGAYGKNISAVFATNAVGVQAAASAARSQKVPTAGAKAAYRRSPYTKPVLKYLYAMGWIGGTRNQAQCGLTLLGQNAARQQARLDMQQNAKLRAQLRRRGVSTHVAAAALVKGVVSACA